MPTDPYMGFTNPVPSSTVGPDYAVDISDALDVIGAHGHTGAPDDGQKITASALDLNGDVDFQSNDATSLRSTRYTSQSAALASGGDVGCFYNKGGDAYWNNDAGTAVQITSGSSLATSAQGLVWPRVSVNGDITILSSDNNVLYDVITSAAHAITLPTAASVTAGRRYVIADASGTGADTNNITIARASSDTIDGAASFVIRSKRGKCVIWSDGSSSWHVFATYNPDAGNIRASVLTMEATAGAASVTASGDITLDTTGGNVSILSDAGTMTLTADSDVAMTSAGGNVTVTSTAGDMSLTASSGGVTVAGAAGVDVTSSGGGVNITATGGDLVLTPQAVTGSVDVHGSTSNSATAGAASALPATPAGYLTIKVNGSAKKIAFY